MQLSPQPWPDLTDGMLCCCRVPCCLSHCCSQARPGHPPDTWRQLQQRCLAEQVRQLSLQQDSAGSSPGSSEESEGEESEQEDSEQAESEEQQ